MKVNQGMGLSDKVKRLTRLPAVWDGLSLKTGVDEKLVLRLYLWGYRIVIYKKKP